MRPFLCVYIDHSGHLVQVQKMFSSAILAKKTLCSLAQQFLFIRPLSLTFIDRFFLFLSPKPRPIDLINFIYLLSNCLQVGYSLIDALGLIIKQITNKRLFYCVGELLIEIRKGRNFSEVILNFPAYFPSYFSAVISSGEMSGDLGGALQRLLLYMEKKDNFYQEFRQSLFYPLILLVSMLLVFIFLLVFVVPQFIQFVGEGVALPLPTVVLFSISNFFVNYSYVLLFSLLVFGGCLYGLCQWSYFYYRCSYLLLKLPLIGPLIQIFFSFRFVKVLDLLISHRVHLLQSLMLLESTVVYPYYKFMFQQLRVSLQQGGTMSVVLFRFKNVLPALLFHSLSVGEKSGTLPKMLINLSFYVDRELKFKIKHFFSIINPTITFLLGFFILLLALGIYLPVFDMITTLL
ncbi:MAG: type II secretion system F family protein [bacterium]